MKNIRLITVILKGYAYLVFAEILCLFINLTLAISGGTLFKVIAAFCTSVIFIGLVCNYAYNTAKNDRVLERRLEVKFGSSRCILAGLSMTLLYAFVWVFLFLSKFGVIGDFYNAYKLINGQFLQIYNLMSPGTEIAAVSIRSLFIMLSFTLVPFIAFVLAYKITYKGIDIERIQYK